MWNNSIKSHSLFGEKILTTYILYFSKKFYLSGFTWQPLGQKSCPEQVQYAPALFLGRAESSKSVSGLKQMHTSGGSWRERHTPNNPFSGHKWKKTVSKVIWESIYANSIWVFWIIISRQCLKHLIFQKDKSWKLLLDKAQ